jgi:hypothetical protein
MDEQERRRLVDLRSDAALLGPVRSPRSCDVTPSLKAVASRERAARRRRSYSSNPVTRPARASAPARSRTHKSRAPGASSSAASTTCSGGCALSPVWRSGCQGAGVDGHCVVGGAGGWCGCGSRGGPAVRGVRDGWSCSYSGAGPRPLFVVPPPSKVERARPGVGAQATKRGVLYASRDGRGRLANRNGMCGDWVG